MKKRVLALTIVLSMLLSFSIGIFPSVSAETTLPTYNAQENFGTEVFSYYSRNISNGVNTEMTFNEGAGLYMNGITANYIGTSYFTTGVNPAIGSMITFTAPYDGTITISNGLEGIRNTGHQVDMTNFAECYAMIYSPDWTVLGDYSIPSNAEFVATPDITGVEVKTGDVIKFLVGSNTPMNSYVYWIPVISYTEVGNLEHQHQWQSEWQFDEDYHWHDCTSSCDITDNAQKDGYGAHSDESGDGKCDVCSYELPQESTLPSYNANEDYGSDVFSYFSRNITNGVDTAMTFNEGASLYMNGVTANYIGTSYLTTGVDPAVCSMVTFTAPYDGVITISNGLEGIRNTGHQVDMTNFAECYAMVYTHDWTNIGDYAIPANSEFVATPDITGVEVKTGDVIKFLVGSNTPMNSYVYWIPVISYTEVGNLEHQHQWQSEWQFDEDYHWHDCTSSCDITDNAQKDGYGKHEDTIQDGACDVCGHTVALPGVEDKVYSFTGMFSGNQTDIWHYLMREVVTNTYTEMSFNGERWEDGKGGIIAKDWLHASADAGDSHEMQVCLEFVAPYDGAVSLSMFGGAIKVGADSQNGVSVAIWKNTDAILSYTDIGPGETYDFAPTEVSVKEGDCIRFLITAISGNNAGDAVVMLPIIAYLKGEDHEAHIWSEEWTANDTHHWHECTSYCDMPHEEKDGYAKHVDIMLDGVCDICSHTVALPGVSNNVYSFTDMFSNSQSGVWKYKMREVVTNTYKNMKWNGERWEDGKGGIIAKDWIHASADAGNNHEMQVCLEYVAPYDGVISLTMFGGAIKVGADSQNGVCVAIWNNTDPILSYTDIGPGETYEFAPKKVSVDKDDCIRFLVTAIGGNNAGDATVMLPIIAYKSIEYRLGPDQGFYSSMDMFSSQQTDIWQYLKREVVSGTIEELTWNGERWIDGVGGIIAKEFMHASADGSDKHEIQMCLSFTAPSDGVVKIGMEDNVIGVSADSQNGVRVGVMHNGNMIYSYTDLSRGRDHYFEPITINITKGDKVYFLLTPIAGNNAGDIAFLVPWIHYLSYEKAPDPVLEEVPDDPSKTYYNSGDDFGGYLNPWYYTYCAFGSQKLIPMTWSAQTNTFVVSGYGGLQISATGSHPYPGYDAVRVFRAPKSGTIRITMDNNGISLGNGTSGAEDGVFVSVRLSDGASITELFKKTLVLPGETLPFEPIELKIYEGWELWFVVNCNTNNASDAAQYLPIVEYLEITNEEAPVYSNREEDTNEPSLNQLNPDISKNEVGKEKKVNIWQIVAVFAATAAIANIILVLVFKRKKKA